MDPELNCQCSNKDYVSCYRKWKLRYFLKFIKPIVYVLVIKRLHQLGHVHVLSVGRQCAVSYIKLFLK